MCHLLTSQDQGTGLANNIIGGVWFARFRQWNTRKKKCVTSQESVLQGEGTYKKWLVVLFTFITSFSSSSSNNASILLKKCWRSNQGCQSPRLRCSVEHCSVYGCSYSDRQSNSRLGNLFLTYCLQWDIQVGPGALTPGLNINPVSALGNPVSPVGSNLVANPIPSPWNFVATVPALAGQFRFVFFSLHYYQTLNSLMAFRIQDPASGSFWGVASLAVGTNVTLGPAGSPNQNWILELVG